MTMLSERLVRANSTLSEEAAPAPSLSLVVARLTGNYEAVIQELQLIFGITDFNSIPTRRIGLIQLYLLSRTTSLLFKQGDNTVIPYLLKIQSVLTTDFW